MEATGGLLVPAARRILVGSAATLQTPLTAGSVYLAALAVAAARREGPPATRPARSALQIATLVPAHNEELVLHATLRDLQQQQHGRDIDHEVIVVADNCTDATAARARALGATAWERHDPDRRGKGHALAWAIERVLAERPAVTAIAIVDADCRVSTNFLSALADTFAAGADAVQVRYAVSNADASTEAALRAAGFLLMHVVRPRGKAALGLSAGLYGTGMAFRRDVLERLPWASFSITEDVEYHLRLVAAGYVVRYVGHAEVTSPMPETSAAARSQHLRWEGGNLQHARRLALRLAGQGLRSGDVQLLHAAAERLVPPQSVLAAGSLAAATLAALSRSRPLLLSSAAGLAAQTTFVLGGLAVAGAPRAVWKALLAAPGLVMRRIGLLAHLGRTGAPTTFVRTERAGTSDGSHAGRMSEPMG